MEGHTDDGNSSLYCCFSKARYKYLIALAPLVVDYLIMVLKSQVHSLVPKQ